MDAMMLRYFREEGQIAYTNITISATLPNLALPANRLRYALLLPTSTATRTIWHFGEQWNSQRIGWFSPIGQTFLPINEDMIGELIRLPLWAWSDAAYNTEITEVSYDPTRYNLMMRCVDEQLSKYRSS